VHLNNIIEIFKIKGIIAVK